MEFGLRQFLSVVLLVLMARQENLVQMGLMERTAPMGRREAQAELPDPKVHAVNREFKVRKEFKELQARLALPDRRGQRDLLAKLV
jgi:hypothetical protein